MSRDLTGKTVRLSFEDGPTKGMSFDHEFRPGGTVAWRDVASGKGGEAKCGTAQISDDVVAMSYLAPSGFTLTVALNFKTMRAVGFASNDKQWFEQHGTFEIVKTK